MKSLFTLLAGAAVLFAAMPAAHAQGRTVVVLRNRPVAVNQPRVFVQPVPRQAWSGRYAGHSYGRAALPNYYNGYAGYYPNYNHSGYYRPWYGSGHGIPAGRNGYVGGLRNLPGNVVQIPHAFGRAGIKSVGRPGRGGGHGGGGHGHGGGGGGKGR